MGQSRRPATERALAMSASIVLLAFGGDALLSSRLPPLTGLRLEAVSGGLDTPVAGVLDPRTGLLLVAEQPGRVTAVDLEAGLIRPVLDISEQVTLSFEAGLVGVAVHPRDERVFVSYTENPSGEQVIASYRRGPDGVTLDGASRQEILRVPQFNNIHQGGTIRFGPDGMLWVGLGDGGGDPASPDPERQDPLGHGQNPHTLPGSIVRIDVDGSIPYSIPPDNPFADGHLGAPEVWAYGVRNPWSLWFSDRILVIGDVGFVTWEEINLLDLDSDAASNLGWSMMEGPDCFAGRDCSMLGARPPELPLARTTGTCAVIAGPVYRGIAMPELVGSLFYTDLCGPWLRTVPIADLGMESTTTWIEDLGEYVTAFVEGPQNELFLLTLSGSLLRIEPTRG